MSSSSLSNTVTLKQAFLIMHAYLEKHWESVGKPDALGALLSELSLWETESGGKEPMDAAVFPDWLACAQTVLDDEAASEGYRGADILLNGKPSTLKAQRSLAGFPPQRQTAAEMIPRDLQRRHRWSAL